MTLMRFRFFFMYLGRRIMSVNCFDKLGVMFDCSRNAVLNKKTFCRMVDILSALGYNFIRLYTEDTYEVTGEPYFGYMRGRYTCKELREMDAYAKSKGVELIPCIQTLAHLNSIFRYKDYACINDADDILLVGEERTYKLIDNMFKSLAKSFTSRTVNIGMDEAFKLGRGQYLDKNGLQPSAHIMRQHLDRVLKIAEKYGFKCEMWGDMFLRSAYGGTAKFTKDESALVRKEVPENLKLICWDYYHTNTKFYEKLIGKYYKLSNNVVFAGGAWAWLGFCPNNRYSIEACEASVSACRKKGIKEYCITVWGDNGGECSPFGILPTLFAVSQFAKGNFNEPLVKEMFKEYVGIEYNLFRALQLPDKYHSIEEKSDTFTASKTQLYSAPFTGIFDAIIAEGKAKDFYQNASAILRQGETHPEWGYLFKTIRTLSDVLEIKFELGVKTRRIYKEGNREAIRELAQTDYAELLVRIKTFYKAHEDAWMREKKPHGFDVQAERLGGLMQRIEHCKDRLIAYADGITDSIPELEEKLLKPLGYKNIKGILMNIHDQIYTVNVP